MKTVNATKFKEQCLSLIEQVPHDGYLITKHGKAVAVVFPAFKKPADFIGCLKGRAKIRGNIFSAGLKWHAQS